MRRCKNYKDGFCVQVKGTYIRCPMPFRDMSCCKNYEDEPLEDMLNRLCLEVDLLTCEVKTLRDNYNRHTHITVLKWLKRKLTSSRPTYRDTFL